MQTEPHWKPKNNKSKYYNLFQMQIKPYWRYQNKTVRLKSLPGANWTTLKTAKSNKKSKAYNLFQIQSPHWKMENNNKRSFPDANWTSLKTGKQLKIK